MTMKKFSILLVFVFLMSLATAHTTAIDITAIDTCPDLLAGLEPCTERHGFLTRLVTPINATCCDQINEIGDTCPGMYGRPWFALAHFSCKHEEILPPPPSTSPSPAPQPSPAVKTCDFLRVKPCLVEMANYVFRRQNSTVISAECCSTLLDLQDSCGPASFRWSFFNKSLHYCQNHY